MNKKVRFSDPKQVSRNNRIPIVFAQRIPTAELRLEHFPASHLPYKWKVIMTKTAKSEVHEGRSRSMDNAVRAANKVLA